MSYQVNGALSDADTIRSALGKHGPLSRLQIVYTAKLDRSVVSASLYRLKKQGDVLENGGVVTLSRGAARSLGAKGWVRI